MAGCLYNNEVHVIRIVRTRKELNGMVEQRDFLGSLDVHRIEMDK